MLPLSLSLHLLHLDAEAQYPDAYAIRLNAMAPSLRMHGCCRLDPHARPFASASRADADADAEPQIRYPTYCMMTCPISNPGWAAQGRTGTSCVIFISRAKDGRRWE
jgi:hypothetical protein